MATTTLSSSNINNSLESEVLLTDKFLSQFPDFPSNMNALGKFVFLRTYSRYIPQLKRRETYKEVCKRASEYNVNLGIQHLKKIGYKVNYDKMKQECELLFRNMFNLKQALSGRSLWIGGTNASKRTPTGNFNCSFINIEKWKDMGDLFYMLLVGTGVGFKCTKEMSKLIEPIRVNTTLLHSKYKPLHPQQRLEQSQFTTLPNGYAKIYVGDSKEGWVQAMRFYFELLTKPEHEYIHTIKISYNSIRPKGTRLKTFGGQASGYEPMKELFEGIDNVLKNRIDETLDPINYNENGYGKVRPIHILDIGNLVGSIVVVGGVRRCIPKGSLVHAKRGLVPIENIQKGEEVLTPMGYKTVTDWFDQGERKLIKIRTQDGYFECTENHRMPVLTSFEEYKWVEAGKLLPGQRLISCRTPIDGSITSLPEWKYEKSPRGHTCKDITIPTLDTDMAWFIGLFHGDGYTYPSYATNGYGAYISVSLGINERNIAEKAAEQIRRFGDLTVTIKQRKNKSGGMEKMWLVYCKSKQLAWYLDKNVKQANCTIRIPQWILESTNDNRLAYIAGILDGDGSATDSPPRVVNTVYPEFAYDIQRVLYSCGIESRLQIQTKVPPSREGWKPIHKVVLITMRSVKMVNEIPQLMKTLYQGSRSQCANGFPIEFCSEWNSSLKQEIAYSTKQKKNQQLNIDCYERYMKESKLCPVEIIDIEPIGSGHTYDITVDGPNEEKGIHEFYVNGYLSHNTSEIYLFDYDDYETLFAKYGINGFWTEEQITNHKKFGEMLELSNIPKPKWFDSLGKIGTQRSGIHHRRMSNNSVAFTSKPTKEYLNIIFKMLSDCGEPGFVNLEEANRRRPNCEGLNPCLTGDTKIFTYNGWYPITDLIGRSFTAIVYGKKYDSTKEGFWSNGIKDVYKLTTKCGYTVKSTNNHKFTRFNGKCEWIELKDLKVGDYIRLNSNENQDQINISEIVEISYVGQEEVYDCTIPDIHCFSANGIISHNCGEILLDSKGLCNLTTVNLVEFVNSDTKDFNINELLEAQKLSARCGLRMTLPELELPDWNFIQQRDRLLGTSLTGVKDALDKTNKTHKEENDLITLLGNTSRNEAYRYAHELRISTPLLTTTIKPEGSLSQIFSGVSSGLHLSHSPFYIRRIRINAADPLAKTVIELGWPVHPEVGTPGNTLDEKMKNARTLVIDFPVASGAKRTKYDTDVKEQMDTYFDYQKYYTDHNSSNTITVRPDEWDTARDIIYDRWNEFVGVSFLQLDNHTYELAPYEAITEEEYNKLKVNMKPFDMNLLIKYESEFEDFTNGKLAGASINVEEDIENNIEGKQEQIDSIEINLDANAESCIGGVCPIR